MNITELAKFDGASLTAVPHSSVNGWSVEQRRSRDRRNHQPT